MARFIVRRIIQSLFLLLGISVLSYAMMRAAPGGPESYFDDPKIPPSTRELLRQQFGLNEPVPVQYGKWLWNALHLNFGYSFIDRRPVIDKILERLPATIELSLASLLLGFIGIPMGVYAAMNRGKLPDYLLRVLTVIGNAVPHWWLGLMILVISANTIRLSRSAACIRAATTRCRTGSGTWSCRRRSGRWAAGSSSRATCAPKSWKC